VSHGFGTPHAVPAFWLHIDLDVLATDELAAVDYRQPGGLTWQELRQIAVAALPDARWLAPASPSTTRRRTKASRVPNGSSALPQISLRW
jgi:hypothetical protein